MLKWTLVSSALAGALLLPAVSTMPARTPGPTARVTGASALLTNTAAPAATGPATSVAPAPTAPAARPSVPPVDRWLGLYAEGAPKAMKPLRSLESRIGTSSPVVNYFTSTLSGFDASLAAKVADHGSVPLITLEFWDPAKGVNQPTLRLKAIASGARDAYLRAYARKAKSFGRTIWLRPFHEMNGNWYPWGGTVNSNRPADLVKAWRHVRKLFTAAGADNVKFVWCPNADSVPNTKANAISKYWPGDAYVDYIALDGYNWGGSAWRSFRDVFASGYEDVEPLSDKPIFIAETACAETGNKARWVADMFRAIPKTFPRIVGVTWFSTNKEHDWRADSTPAVLKAFKVGARRL